MQINPDRIRDDLNAIAGFTETPGEGSTRPTFSTAWRQARDYVITRAEMHGCHTRVDSCGNVHLRPRHLAFDAPAWLSGSHIDTVPNGGDYDGVVGIVAPLEILRAAHEAGKRVRLETIIFAEEEGPTFGLGMLGSRAWVGDLSANDLAKLKNAQGESYLEAGHPHGVVPTRIGTDRLKPSAVLGFVELHIEQGPAMWEEQVPLAVVSAIAGRKQFRVTLTGRPNHAGSTPMHYRADPLVAAAKIITEVDAIARAHGTKTVATVGRIECEPNAVNVIPGVVRFTIDLRSPDASVLASCHEAFKKLIASVEKNPADFVMTEDQPPVLMDTKLVGTLTNAAARLRMPSLQTGVSGALHDSAILAPHVPTAMLFVPSRDGISHNPAEFSRVEDIAAATRVLAEVVST